MKFKSPIETGGSGGSKKGGGVRKHLLNVFSLFIAVYFTFGWIQTMVIEKGFNQHPIITVLVASIPLYVVWFAISYLLDKLFEHQGY